MRLELSPFVMNSPHAHSGRILPTNGEEQKHVQFRVESVGGLPRRI